MAVRPWIQERLAKVKSTDDPDYWERQASQDPTADTTGQSWWLDAIDRGDGSELVTSGQLQRRGAGDVDRGPAGRAWMPPQAAPMAMPTPPTITPGRMQPGGSSTFNERTGEYGDPNQADLTLQMLLKQLTGGV